MKAIKNILSLGLVFLLLLHTNYLIVYYSLYEINTEELIESCCEKIVVNCNAHCYLDKKMSEDEGRNSNGTTSEIKLKITEYLITEFTPTLKSNEINIPYSNHNNIQLKDYSSEIDHPPQL